MAENEKSEKSGFIPSNAVSCPECGHVFQKPAANELQRQPGVDGPYLDDVRRQQEEAYRSFKNERETGLVEVGLDEDSEINSHTDADGNELKEVTDLPKSETEIKDAEAEVDEGSDSDEEEENVSGDADGNNEDRDGGLQSFGFGDSK